MMEPGPSDYLLFASAVLAALVIVALAGAAAWFVFIQFYVGFFS